MLRGVVLTAPSQTLRIVRVWMPFAVSKQVKPHQTCTNYVYAISAASKQIKGMRIAGEMRVGTIRRREPRRGTLSGTSR